jgi:hypothetical protein
VGRELPFDGGDRGLVDEGEAPLHLRAHHQQPSLEHEPERLEVAVAEPPADLEDPGHALRRLVG